KATAWNAVPAKRGDLLNLRDIEQALENFKRVPTVEADIQITPAEGDDARPGESDLVVLWQQRSPPVRFSVSLDDSGSKATGKLQGGATLSLDDLLMWNDLFYANFNHDVFNGNSKGTRGYTAHYSVPYGYWTLSA
ncbi:ShlB/FhaC/HecB family hemolysin secretion/activation protein, partial [Pseudomonas aeruginosa]|nr:ShlB/FhaC/HecB family hemolysin secretion/activation protein [Pseudomonas aeruginosa]